MNCQTIEQLIPLFVEADLDGAEMQQVTNHLETCAACHSLATEFRASQSSLHTLAAPEFDEGMMSAMRRAVQREIARPTTMDWLTLWWNWKLVGAAAAACLLLGGFVLYRHLPTSPNKPVVAREQQTDKPAATNLRAADSVATVPRVVASHRPARKPSSQSNALATARDTVPAPLVAEPVAASPSPAVALTAPAETATPAAEPEMLRMEFQTADPNIRIIWLTPKEPARTNPAADTK